MLTARQRSPAGDVGVPGSGSELIDDPVELPATVVRRLRRRWDEQPTLVAQPVDLVQRPAPGGVAPEAIRGYDASGWCRIGQMPGAGRCHPAYVASVLPGPARAVEPGRTDSPTLVPHTCGIDPP